jgi:DNA invertase Pin-like site-specific DNA recombinase
VVGVEVEVTWAIYVRSEDAGERWRQTCACDAWLDQLHPDEVYLTYTDDRPGDTVARPVLADLLVAIKARGITDVVIESYDVLADSMTSQEYLRGRFLRADARLHVVSPTYSLERLRIACVVADINDRDRDMMRARGNAVRRHLVKQGRFMGGQIGEGMTVDTVTKEKNWKPEIFPLIRDGMLMRELGVAMASIGEFWLQGGFRPRSTPQWHAGTVNRVLNRAYKMNVEKPGSCEPSTTLSAAAQLYVGNKR